MFFFLFLSLAGEKKIRLGEEKKREAAANPVSQGVRKAEAKGVVTNSPNNVTKVLVRARARGRACARAARSLSPATGVTVTTGAPAKEALDGRASSRDCSMYCLAELCVVLLS